MREIGIFQDNLLKQRFFFCGFQISFSCMGNLRYNMGTKLKD